MPLKAASKCNSRPDCFCPFCERTRTEPSERDQLDQLANEYIGEYIGESLREWWIAGQRKDARLAMAEWAHALREWQALNVPRCQHGEFFDSCSTCLTHPQISALIQ
jgi:hypothetical protein